MTIAPDIAYFFGGAFFANSIPHWVSGAMGRPFQSPFAKPPGEGLSSSRINVAWGGFNLVVAWLLFSRIGDFDWRNPEHALAAAIPAFLGTYLLSGRFGRFNGGNT